MSLTCGAFSNCRYLKLVAEDEGFDGLAAAFDSGDIPDGASLYHTLKEYDCPVLSYSGFARGRKKLIDGGIANPQFGVASGAKRVTEIITGVSARQHMAFSGHSVCETCSFINAKLAEAQSRDGRAYWIAQKGAHNLDVKKDRVKEQELLAGDGLMGGDKTAKVTGAVPSLGFQTTPAWNSMVRGSQYTTSIYIWFSRFNGSEVWGAILVPPWVKTGANLTCTLRHASDFHAILFGRTFSCFCSGALPDLDSGSKSDRFE
jgi:hypothetical protein